MSDNQGTGGRAPGAGAPGSGKQGGGGMPGNGARGMGQAGGATGGTQGQPGQGQAGGPALGRPMPTQGMQGGPRMEKPRSSRQTFARLLEYLAPHKAAIAGVIALVIASTALALLGPYLVGVAIDRYISTKIFRASGASPACSLPRTRYTTWPSTARAITSSALPSASCRRCAAISLATWRSSPCAFSTSAPRAS